MGYKSLSGGIKKYYNFKTQVKTTAVLLKGEKPRNVKCLKWAAELLQDSYSKLL